MHIIILGGTGFIGTALSKKLSENGCHVTIPTHIDKLKNSQNNIDYVFFNGHNPVDLAEIINGADAVVNLVGENIGAKRWSFKQKEKILNSRVNIGKIIVQAMQLAEKKPEVLIQASAIGYYGYWAEFPVECTEECPHGKGFLADVTLKWEASTKEVESLNVRRCVIRTAPVLGRHGGMLAKIVRSYLYYIGGPMGTGKQPFSWIHMEDEVNAIYFLITTSHLSGVFNLCSPNPSTMNEFCQITSKILKKPNWLRTPDFVTEIFLGDMAKELILNGQRTLPAALTEAGFDFKYPTLEEALNEALS